MKRRFTLFVLFIFFITAFIFDASRNPVTSNDTGAPAARTGSPGDNFLSCTDCHGGPNEIPVTGWITSDIPAAGYVGGNTYTITATITRPGHVKFGFEVSPQNISGTQLGTLLITSPGTTKLVGSGKYVTHTSGGTSGAGGSKAWSFNWTAPAQGTGDVTFYGAFNATNNMNNSSGDSIFLSTLTVSECIAPTQPGSITGNTNLCAAGSQTYWIHPVPNATSYDWSLPAGWSGSSTDTSITVNAGASGGTISVSAVNACGSGSPSSLTITSGAPSISFANVTNVSCSGGTNGSATASPSGGSGSYTYSWNTNPVQTNATAVNLSQGNYVVTVTDGAGCISTAQTSISQPAAITISAAVNHVACQGLNSGSANVKVTSGGVSPFTYSWNSTPVQNNDTAFNLPAGTYVATVTDANGCTKTSSVTISLAPAMTLSTSGSNITCNGGTNGSATAVVTGGTNPITYSWNTTPAQTTATASSLPAGNYSVTVTDNSGCTKTSLISITQPTAISATATKTNVTCHGASNGTASVIASGGTGSLAYSWNTIPAQSTPNVTGLAAGTYTVIVKDANNCTKSASVTITQPSQIVLTTSVNDADCSLASGSASVSATGGSPGYTYSWNTVPPQANDTISGLQAGVYTVTVTDQTGCTAQSFATVGNTSGLIVNAGAITNVNCNGENTGAASITINGGVQPYDIVWTPSGDTTLSISGAAAGTYNVSVSDVNGCIASVVLSITEPTALTAYAGSAYDLCDGDSAFLGSSPTAFGGVGPYSYSWFPSVGLNSDTASNPVAVISSTSNYDLTVTDANGCTTTSSINIVVHPLAAVPVISMSGDTLFCSQADFYQWYESGIIINGADTGFYLPTHSADYTVVVTDSNGCSVESVVYSFVLGISNDISEEGIAIYPNPANNYFEIDAGKNLQYHFSLYDLYGKLLHQENSTGKATVVMDNYGSGIYLLVMHLKDKVIVRQIALQ